MPEDERGWTPFVPLDEDTAETKTVEFLVHPTTGGLEVLPKPDCPRANSFMTPCVLRDGDTARADSGHCVGCDLKTIPELEDGS